MEAVWFISFEDLTFQIIMAWFLCIMACGDFYGSGYTTSVMAIHALKWASMTFHRRYIMVQKPHEKNYKPLDHWELL